MVRCNEKVLIVDVSLKIATKLAEVELWSSKRWCESMAVVHDRSKSEIKYLVTEMEGDKINVCFHAVEIAEIEEKFKKDLSDL